MNVKSVEKKENYAVELTVEVGEAEFEAGLEQAYKKNRGSISIPGFRKGKAPRKVIEGMYGAGVFYEDAVEAIYPAACDEAIAQEKLDIVAAPQVEVTSLDQSGFTFKATVIVRPEVTLNQYKELEADKVLATVTDADVDAELQTFVDRATTLEVVERAAENGDTANIDFEGFLDGVAFDGGKGENFDLVLGSGSFIPGFEEQVVGMTAGEEKDVNVTFPEDYHAEELAGKPVVFKVKANEIKGKVVPALDDEFAKDVSEFETLEEFKKDLRAKIADRHMAQSEGRFKQTLLEKLAEQVEIELPGPMVESHIDGMLEEYNGRLSQQGISMEAYLRYMNMTMEGIREELRPSAERQLKVQLALDAVVKAEGIQIPDEVVEGEFTKMSEAMNVPVDQIKTVVSPKTISQQLARDKALGVVTDTAKANLVSGEVKEDGEIEIEEVKADEEQPAEEKPVKKTRAKKAAPKTEDGEPAPKKTTRKKKTETEEPTKTEE